MKISARTGYLKKLLKQLKPIAFRILVIVFIVLFYHCPFRLLFKMDCPGCGMTRAFLSALKLDFKTAFYYHPLFLLFGIELFYALFCDYIKKFVFVSPKVESIVYILSMILLFIVWIIRQFII